MGRQCGVCRYGHSRDLSTDIGVPSAASVLLFSRTTLYGRKGIVAKMETMAEDLQVPLSSAYCEKCRQCTWLTRDENDIDQDCLDFMRHWSVAQKIKKALSIIGNTVKRKHCPSEGKINKTCSDSQMQGSGSTEKKQKRSKCGSG